MDITREVMQGWGWSEQAIDWYMEDRRIIAELTASELGYYLGVLDAICYENGSRNNGLSRHALPDDTMLSNYADGTVRFNYRTFLAVMADVDSDGHIFTPGLTRVKVEYGEKLVFALHCTESPMYSEPEQLTDVTWGYAESLEVWEAWKVREL